MDKYLISIGDEFGDELGINLISFVKNPAIMVKGMAFNQEVKPLNFVNDDVKMRIIAPAMIPMDIYRYSREEDYEYEVRFTSEVIEKIRDKFMKNLTNKDIFNLEHSDEITPAYILETWIVGKDPKQDKAFSEYGLEVPSGTMMVMSQITDRNYYDKLVENEQFAYSIEGFFGLDELKLMIEKKKETNMEDLKLPDGEHQIGEKIYVVKDGKLIEIKDVIAAEEVKPEEEKVEAAEVVEEEVEASEEAPSEEEAIEAEDVKEEEVKMAIDEVELMTILQPKFDEIYKMIADLSAKLETEDEDEIPSEEVKMSAIERFTAVHKFLKKK